MKIELLDYTIRASLSNRTTVNCIQEYADMAYGIAESGIENVELGYLADDENWLCKPLTDRIEDYDSLAFNRKAVYSVMIHPSGYDVNQLPMCSGKVQRIRVLLRYEEKAASIAMMQAICAKGYQVICDIDQIYEYSDAQLLRLCEELKDISLNQITIVDCTEVMDGRSVQRVALLLDNNLPDEIKIGLRSGENNGMAQFIANNFLDAPLQKTRTTVVESSLLGIGFVRNNLCTECIADQLNEGFSGHYDYEHLIALISIFIPEVNQDPGNAGGYHPIFYLTAKNQVDGDYGRYFLSKGIMLHKINDLLKQVAETQRFEFFDEAIAEQIYLKNKEALAI